MVPLLTAEAAAAFDDLTMSGRDSLLTEQGTEDWPNAFRIARFYPAVEYIQANRARTLAVRQVSALLRAGRHHRHALHRHATHRDQPHRPSGAHPAQRPARPRRPTPPAIDDGDHDDIGGPGTPVSLTFLAALYQDAKLAAFARAYQEATGFHKLHPELG